MEISIYELLKKNPSSMKVTFPYLSYLAEYEHFDGEDFITFNVIEVRMDEKKAFIAVTNRGRISQLEYDVFFDNKGYYFEYGPFLTRIYLNNFEVIENE